MPKWPSHLIVIDYLTALSYLLTNKNYYLKIYNKNHQKKTSCNWRSVKVNKILFYLLFVLKLQVVLNNIISMPKLIDNYVLSRKIGAGQYGEVFKGYDRATNNDIAVKSIRRQNVKGKFKELLESQIKVLKSCESHNIIKLYDMKKTSNNYYLILEYCNDGDLQAYVKKRKYLTEEEAIQILCEVINGFHHLYQHKILHRDLKLANILRHDGVTKIADFGFSKMLGNDTLCQTMLGSPLNMAPEVLHNLQYSNKADIYSLGVCYYWMLFGKPPYNAKNINELKSMISKQNFDFPKAINSISDMSKNLIRKMLRANPKQRMSWQQLFQHEINSYIEKKMEKQFTLTLTMDGSLSDNVCKLYLNQNLVIIHPSEFRKKQEVVEYAVNLVKDNKKNDFKGNMVNRALKQNNQNIKRQQLKNNDKIDDLVTEDQKIINQIQDNTFYLLAERNKIIFLLSVLNELRSKSNRKNQSSILFQILKSARVYYEKLQKSIRLKQNVYKLPYWKPFIESISFKNLEHFLLKEEIIVKHEMDGSEKFAQNSNQPLAQLVKGYSDVVLALLKKDELDEKNRPEWIHLNHLLDVVRLDQIMTKDFDFKHYYCEYGKYEMKQLVDFTKKNLSKL